MCVSAQSRVHPCVCACLHVCLPRLGVTSGDSGEQDGGVTRVTRQELLVPITSSTMILQECDSSKNFSSPRRERRSTPVPSLSTSLTTYLGKNQNSVCLCLGRVGIVTEKGHKDPPDSGRYSVSR